MSTSNPLINIVKHGIMVTALIMGLHSQSLAETVTEEDLKNVNSRFFHYVNAYIVSSALYQEAVKINANMHFSCNEEYKILPGEMTVLQPIVFDKNILHPTSGVWHHRYSVTRCSKTIMYNTYVIANKGKTPIIVSGLNGDSKVPFNSLFEISVATYTYVNYHYGPCPAESKYPQPFIYSTEVLHTPDESASTWQERWTVEMCDAMIPLRMTMHNDAGDKLNFQISPEAR